jgi:hypothetical protein
MAEEHTQRSKRNRGGQAGKVDEPLAPTTNTTTAKTTAKGKKSHAKSQPEEVIQSTSTLRQFTTLIARKHPSVSWVGSYTTAHTNPDIEIGFLKALTVLLSFYQGDVDGATHCPVAMVSGPASLGRRLAIFYSSCENLYRWRGASRTKVNLSISFKMENQTMRTLAKRSS